MKYGLTVDNLEFYRAEESAITLFSVCFTLVFAVRMSSRALLAIAASARSVPNNQSHGLVSEAEISARIGKARLRGRREQIGKESENRNFQIVPAIDS